MFFTAYLVILWCAYPVVWGLAEGSNTISVTAEVRERALAASARQAGRHNVHM